MLGPPLISLTHKVLLRFLPLSFPFSAACSSASSHTLCQPSALFSLSSSSSCTSFFNSRSQTPTCAQRHKGKSADRRRRHQPSLLSKVGNLAMLLDAASLRAAPRG